MSFVTCYDDSLKDLSYDESMRILTSYIPKPDSLKTISPVSGVGEERIQAIGMEVLDYTKRVVLFSDNYPDRWDDLQYLPFKKYHEVLNALGVVTGQMRRRYPLQGTEKYLQTVSDIAHETRVGNCLGNGCSRAATGFYGLLLNIMLKPNYIRLNSEIMRYASLIEMAQLNKAIIRNLALMLGL